MTFLFHAEDFQRFGNAITSTGVLNLKHRAYSEDFSPVEPGCGCSCCRPKEAGGLGISRAFIHHLAAKETVGAHMYDLSQFMIRMLLIASSLTMHNVHHLLSLMKAARDAIIEDRFPGFVREFFAAYYKDRQVPSWAIEALEVVGISLD